MLERFLPSNSVNTLPNVAAPLATPLPSTLKIFPARYGSQGGGNGIDSYDPEALMHKLLELDLPGPQGRRLVIEGEAGTGKTLFLKHVAAYLLAHPQEGLPLWINPQQLKNISLGDYLFGPWLEQARQGEDGALADWQSGLKELLRQGRVWLLADGLDYLYWDTPNGVKTGPLSLLKASLQAWPRLNVILTCRPETRRSDPKGLAGFERYRIQEFEDSNLIAAAIGDYFSAAGSDADAAALMARLQAPQSRSIAQWLTAPIRLILFCRVWQSAPSQFPENSAQLYALLTQAFFEWKAEEAVTNREQRRALTEIFGKLGQYLLLEGRDGNQPLSQADVETVFGKNSPLLRLALQLGWLIPRGLLWEGAWERGYGFFDRSFRDYFTALAIRDWRFFWDVHRVNYRALEPQWRSVIAFWLGRTDIPEEERRDFLDALLNFQDGCSPENFYGLQALKVAVLACGELPDCPQAQTALKTLADWAAQPQLAPSKERLAQTLLEKTDPHQRGEILLARLDGAETEEEYRRLLRLLRQWGQGVETVITGLERQLALLETSGLRFPVAETLGELAPGREGALGVFLKALSAGSQSPSWGTALQGLGKIGQGNPSVIQTLLDLLNQSLPAQSRRQVLETLVQIAEGHDLAIASLLQQLRRSANGAPRCQVAETLEKIDPGNPAALSALRGFLQDKTDPDLRKQAIYSLGELKNPSDADIDALAQLLQPEEDIFLQWLAVSSLSKTGGESLRAKTALEGLLQRLLTEPLTDSAEGLLKETIDALVKLDPANEWAVQALIYRLGQTQDLHACQEHAELLGRLDPGNPNAINALLTLLKKGQDEFVQRQAAASLGIIDPGNLTALMALIHLLHNGQSQDVRVMAAESLGIIGVNNPAAMAALLRTASGQPSRELLRAIVGSLGKIAQDNKEVSQVLLELFRSQTDPQLRLLIAECLQRILPNKMLTGAIHQLRDCCRRPYGQNTAADWEFFWHCAQRLPFPVFYQAWHQRPLKGEPHSDPARRQRERQALIAQLDSLAVDAKPLQTLWIDAGQFLSPQDPSVDIYDQMLSQGCPEFIHGIPDSPSKLRLYWHQLQRQRADHCLLLCLDYANGQPETPEVKDFLTRLQAFQGAIIILSNQKDLPLKTFSLPYDRVFGPLRDWLLSDDR